MIEENNCGSLKQYCLRISKNKQPSFNGKQIKQIDLLEYFINFIYIHYKKKRNSIQTPQNFPQKENF